MAKKSKDGPETSGPIDYVKLAADSINKSIGKNVCTDTAEFLSRPKHIIKWSPSLDLILSGGIPEGSWVSVSGPPKTGKTTSLLYLAAKAQRPEYGNKTVWYLNVEGRIKEMNLNGIKGLIHTDPSRFRLIGSTEEKLMTTEDYLNAADTILKTQPGAFIIIDSMSALADGREVEGGVGTQTRGNNQKLISQFVNNACNLVPVRNAILCGVNHIYSNTSGKGPPRVEKTSARWLYQADVRLRLIMSKPWVSGGEEIGKEITWKCEAAALGGPNKMISSRLRYNVGIDEVAEILQFGKSSGLIEEAAAGGWCSLVYLAEQYEGEDKVPKLQGLEKLSNYMDEHPEHYELLRSQIASMSGGLVKVDSSED